MNWPEAAVALGILALIALACWATHSAVPLLFIFAIFVLL